MPPPELFSESPDGKPCNLITRENYEYLRDSFFRYASLMKKEAVHAPGLTMAEGITRLHDEMSDLVGNDMNVNIEQDGERLIFRLWKCHRWGELTLYYFPVKFVENLGPELRRISVTFIHNLMQANGIDTILDEDDTEYALTWLAEENDDEQDDRKKRLKLLHSYEKGRIHSLLRRVERKSYYKDLPKAIGRYKPANGYEQSLLSAMKEGLEFLSPERGIMEYGYDPFYEEEPDYLPMYLNRQIRVVYDCNDPVTDNLVDYYNSYSRETYDIIPVTTCDLSPETEELFRMDDYPERFFKCKYSINSLVYWVTYVHNVVYSFYRSMIYCYINSTQRCAGSIVIDIIPTNGADKRKFFPFAPYFPVTNVIKRYFYPYFPAIIGIKGYSFPYFPYLSGIMKIKTALYSLFSRLDWHKTVVFPCLGEIYEGIRSLSWEIPVT